MQIGQLTVDVLALQSLLLAGNKKGASEQNDDQRRCRCPAPMKRSAWAGRYALLNLAPELGRGRIAFARSLNLALELYSIQHHGGARRTTSQVVVQGPHLVRWQFAIQVDIEFPLPLVASHAQPPPNFCRRMSRSAPRARDNRDITVPIGTAKASAISW